MATKEKLWQAITPFDTNSNILFNLKYITPDLGVFKTYLLESINSNALSASSPAVLVAPTDNTVLAQMRPNEGVGFANNLNGAIGQAATDAINNLPPPARALIQALRNTPPDAIAAGTVVTLPNGLKIGLFLLQPSMQSNALIPDLSKSPTIFFSIPSKGLVGTYNPNNNQVEWGGGAAKPLLSTGLPRSPNLPGINDSLFFYNVRDGGSLTDGKRSTSGNFGVLNSTVSDPIAKWGIDQLSKGVTQIARALEAAGILGDVVTVPSGEGVVAAVTVEAARLVLVEYIKKSTTWFVGPAWRGVDYEMYGNGETTLNVSGGKIRLSDGQGLGGSGLSTDKFIVDLPNVLGSLGGVDRNKILSTNDPKAQRLGNILYSAYVEGGQNESRALIYTINAFKQGGKAQLAQRAVEVLNATPPNSVNDRAFANRGMGEEASTLAKGVYDHLRQVEGYSPQQAWGAVWSNYVVGNNSQINSGIVNGGNAGGINALKALANNIGLDPAPYLPRR
ncbi:MAG: hypothetical protein SGJ17_09795 [Hyphomicrobiales bacterium]|nr:hypothetical protein [Hyphomicrobiales bacterium]